ncbi:MAG: hypothetical protein ACU836_12330 [Gammaproteobacteria bacterium]
MSSPIGIRGVEAGALILEAEQGDYYKLSKLGIWIEFYARATENQVIGARWTIDNWKSHHESLALPKVVLEADIDLWRIEINDIVTTGWRDGRIGGPNGEQPSANRWILWGTDKTNVECLPFGAVPPRFEFALYRKRLGYIEWENNQGRNFSLCLDNICRR